MSDDTRKATRLRSPDEPCLNCGDPRSGRFCPNCGQRKVQVLVSVRTLLADVLEDQLVLNRALPRTLVALLFRPGFLTREYVRGRIVSYIPPFRLYLALSIVFFLLVSFFGLRALHSMPINITGLPTDPDSIRTELVSRRATLSRIDTTGSAVTRAAVRDVLLDIDSALLRLDEDPASLDTAMLAGIFRRALADMPLPMGERQPWARFVERGTWAPWLAPFRDQKLNQIGHLPPRQAAAAVMGDMLEYASVMVFLLLPLFALVLKLLYIRRDRFYAEHFIFALHVHAFVFLLFILIFVNPFRALDLLLSLWLLGYVWLAMKHFYRQGWFRTTLKWGALATVYFLLLTAGTLALFLAALIVA